MGNNKTGNHNIGNGSHMAKINKLRVKEVKTCAICGAGFEGLKVQVFCSNKCRQKNKRQKADKAKRGEFFGGVE